MIPSLPSDVNIEQLSPAQQEVFAQEKRAKEGMKGKTQQLGNWRKIADDILSAMLCKPDALSKFTAQMGHAAHFPEGRWQALYKILLGYIPSVENGVINDNAIKIAWLAGSNKVSFEEEKWFSNLWDQRILHYRTQTYAENITLLKAASARYWGEKALDKHASAFKRGDTTLGELRSAIVDDFTRIESSTQNNQEGVTGKELAHEMGGFEENTTDEILPSTLPAVREAGYGFLKGYFSLIAGAQKSQKTRLALSQVLYSLMNGKTVAIFSLELSKKEIVRYLGCMLAAQSIIAQYGEEMRDTEYRFLHDVSPLHWFTNEGRMILRHEIRKKHLYAAQTRLADYGERLRIYDAKHGIMMIDTLEGLLKADCERFGVPDQTMVDHTHHILGFESGDNLNGDYSKITKVKGVMHQHCQMSGTAMLLLAQRNLASNTSKVNMSNLLGIKGGEALSEAATLGIVTQGYVDNEGNKTVGVLHYSVRSGRFGEMDWDLQRVKIHPPSGYVFPDGGL